jgi:hypothetical protein
VFVLDELAAALWLPPVEPLMRPVVGLQRLGGRPLPVTPDLEVRQGVLPELATVTVSLTVGGLRTLPPGELALMAEHASFRRALRSVAATLDAHAARDGAGRRSPAHREPRRQEELFRLMFARPWTDRFLPPDRHDGRGWRLDDEVGMRQWIERRAQRR